MRDSAAMPASAASATRFGSPVAQRVGLGAVDKRAEEDEREPGDEQQLGAAIVSATFDKRRSARPRRGSPRCRRLRASATVRMRAMPSTAAVTASVWSTTGSGCGSVEETSSGAA